MGVNPFHPTISNIVLLVYSLHVGPAIVRAVRAGQ